MAKAKKTKNKPKQVEKPKKVEKKVKEPVALDINNPKHGNLTDAERAKL